MRLALGLELGLDCAKRLESIALALHGIYPPLHIALGLDCAKRLAFELGFELGLVLGLELGLGCAMRPASGLGLW